jgi:hypothetical protein
MDYAPEKVNFGIQPRCTLFLLVRNHGDTERIVWNLVQKTGREKGGSRF